MAVQPIGTVTMVFTDIEGSTRVLEQLGRDRYALALDLYRRLLREAFGRRGVWDAKTRSACKFDVSGVQVKVLVSHAPAIY